jgi:hypothetical protein
VDAQPVINNIEAMIKLTTEQRSFIQFPYLTVPDKIQLQQLHKNDYYHFSTMKVTKFFSFSASGGFVVLKKYPDFATF